VWHQTTQKPRFGISISVFAKGEVRFCCHDQPTLIHFTVHHFAIMDISIMLQAALSDDRLKVASSSIKTASEEDVSFSS
jgi:hypothetical protein